MTNNNDNDNNNSLADILSLPMDFAVDPLVATTTSTIVSPLPPPVASGNQKRKSIERDDSVASKKSRLSLDDKDQKTKERILRNRAAAQESRDKKRRYVSELESNNKQLTEQNEALNEQVKQLQAQNALITAQLEAITRQLTELPHMKFDNVHPILFNDFCDSARIVKKECLSY
ncbi:hypothetical protein EDC96DRAFT_510347 [Choanephora cucurbitarum]|nr:hypothetical protein EDC96DRAFT_510347 [Choanephora cucurbitarum]